MEMVLLEDWCELCLGELATMGNRENQPVWSGFNQHEDRERWFESAGLHAHSQSSIKGRLKNGLERHGHPQHLAAHKYKWIHRLARICRTVDQAVFAQS